MLKQESTRPPQPLAEGDLIARMEQHGIGTDATVATHIQKQLDRGWVSCFPRDIFVYFVFVWMDGCTNLLPNLLSDMHVRTRTCDFGHLILARRWLVRIKR